MHVFLYARKLRSLVRPTLRVLAAALAVSACGSGVARAAGTALSTELPRMSDSFADAIGATSHFSYTNTPYVTKFSVIAPEVVASGLRHLRDSDEGTVYRAKMDYFAAHGVKHSIGFNVGTTAAQVEARLKEWGPEIDFVETANEWDTTSSTNPGWASQLHVLQKLLYTTVHAGPAAPLPVLGPSIANPNLYSAVGDLAPYEDAGNLHNGSCDWNPGVNNYDSIADWMALARIITPDKPIWTTEIGYNNNMTRPCSLPNAVIAKYDPRTIAEYWNAGEPKIYFYQLVDTPDDPIFGGMGLIDATGAPKPQFTAVSSLIHLVADPGPAFTTTALPFSFTGNMASLEHTLLQRRDGTYELLFWLEQPSWDHNRRVQIVVPNQSITLQVPFQLRAAQLYTYGPDLSLHQSPFGGCTRPGRCARASVTRAIGFTGTTLPLTASDSVSVLMFR